MAHSTTYLHVQSMIHVPLHHAVINDVLRQEEYNQAQLLRCPQGRDHNHFLSLFQKTICRLHLLLRRLAQPERQELLVNRVFAMQLHFRGFLRSYILIAMSLPVLLVQQFVLE